jgi:hypothetical protein
MDFFKMGSASAQWPLVARLIPRSAAADGDSAADAFLETWAPDDPAGDPQMRTVTNSIRTRLDIEKQHAGKIPTAKYYIRKPEGHRQKCGANRIECLAPLVNA